ncbi:MAG: hypothetical protein H7843_14805 [Nitrospirota bacterium]
MSELKSFYWRIFGGRSVMGIIFGSFFENKNNTAGIISVLPIGTLCYLLIINIDNMSKLPIYDDICRGVLNVIFVVVGYYFGAKQNAVKQDEEEDKT